MTNLAHFDRDSPARYDRVQLLLRLVLLAFLGIAGWSGGWTFLLLYLGLPLLAAIVIASGGPDAYRQRTAPVVIRFLRWFVGIHAYVEMISDRFPTREDELVVRFDVDASAPPSAGAALWPLLRSLPAAIVLALLSLVSGLLWIASAVTILVDRTVPESFVRFQRGMLRMFAELLLHHASVTPGPAPIHFDTTAGGQPATAAA